MKLLLIITLFTGTKDPWFARDKVRHFAVSYVITRSLIHYRQKKEIAFGITFSLGLIKEIYDKKIKKSFFSYKDLVWDLAGVGLALI